MPGVVDHDVDSPEFVGRVDGDYQIIGIRHVTLDIMSPAVGFVLDEIVCRLAAFTWFFPDVGNDDIRAVVGERPGDCPTESACAACDDCRSVCK